MKNKIFLGNYDAQNFSVTVIWLQIKYQKDCCNFCRYFCKATYFCSFTYFQFCKFSKNVNLVLIQAKPQQLQHDSIKRLPSSRKQWKLFNLYFNQKFAFEFRVALQYFNTDGNYFWKKSFFCCRNRCICYSIKKKLTDSINIVMEVYLNNFPFFC